MPAVDSKSVPVARRDLTTPWLAEYLPRKHVTGTSLEGLHVNLKHSRKFKELNKQSITKLFGNQMVRSN